MKKRIIFTAALLICASMLSACNSGGAANSGIVVTESGNYITERQAELEALSHAGFGESEVTGLNAKRDGSHYDIEFFRGNTEYDYEIDAKTGEVLSFEQEEDKAPAATTAANTTAAPTETTAAPAETTATSFDTTDAPPQTDAPIPESPDYFSPSAAEDKALAHAGVDRADAEGLHTTLDQDGRVLHYDVEFYSGNTEYDYEIDAYTGEVLSHSKETEAPKPSAGQTQSYISNTVAEDKALSHAGVDRADAEGLHTTLDQDGRVLHYDVEFYSGNTEYDYEIDAYTGEVLSHSKETENVTPPTEQTQSYIGDTAAEDKALSHAGVSRSNAQGLHTKLDLDGRSAHYDIEFYSGNTEYDYEIDAYTGEVLSHSKETEAPKPSAGQTQSYIGDTAAEDKALSHAGVSRSNAQGLHTKLDAEGRSAHYDIEFYSGNTEYDYEIDAYTGEVLSHSKETEAPKPSAGQTQSYIGDTAAEDKALSHAGVSRSNAQGLHTKLDLDGRSAHYDIEFRSGNIEYEYEIDAYSGNIIDFDKDIDD